MSEVVYLCSDLFDLGKIDLVCIVREFMIIRCHTIEKENNGYTELRIIIMIAPLVISVGIVIGVKRVVKCEEFEFFIDAFVQ